MFIKKLGNISVLTIIFSRLNDKKDIFNCISFLLVGLKAIEVEIVRYYLFSLQSI